MTNEADLSDDWVDRTNERPPTIRFAISPASSVKVFADSTQKWNNSNIDLSRDLVTKETKPLTSLFVQPTAPPLEHDTSPVIKPIYDAGLSIVMEELDEALNHGRTKQDKSSEEFLDKKTTDVEYDKRHSDAGTIKAVSLRSNEGIITNFSFPTMQQGFRNDQDVIETSNNNTFRAASDPLHSSMRPVEVWRHPSASSEPEALSTPKKNTHKSSSSSVSPTKSPLKLFHAEPDTFTRDHAARMIGMLSAVAAPQMASIGQADSETNTQKSIQSAVSCVSEVTDSGPERKRVKTHEQKGSITLQNFNDNADRTAAKLRAKAGGLGKGLPRVLEDTKPAAEENKVILGRRISTPAERLNQMRKKERSGKTSAPIRVSGFEDVKFPIDRFVSGSDSGTGSKKSHFSDWESDVNTESRRFSALIQTEAQDLHGTDHEIANPPSRSSDASQNANFNGQRSSPTLNNVESSTSANAKTSSPNKRSPRFTNYPPPQKMQTLRCGNMIFDTARQCWRQISETTRGIDALETVPGEVSSQVQSCTVTQHEDSRSHYPDEIELSSNSSQTSYASQMATNLGPEVVETLKQSGTSGPVVLTEASPRMSLNAVAVGHLEEDFPSVILRQTGDASAYEERLANLTADLTMSQSTEHLLNAVCSRYGEGPWESVGELDLSNLELDSLSGISTFFPSLVALDISNNRLTSLHDLPQSLQYLKASGNRLTSHRTSFAHLPNLVELDLADNRMEDLDSFRPLVHLRRLRLSNNQLTCIDGLRYLSNIISIEARRNMLTVVDLRYLETSKALQHLESIDLADNELIQVAGIEFLEALLEINISRNALHDLPISRPMPHLKILNAANNRLTDIDVAQMSKIRILYLDDNEIMNLSLNMVAKHIEVISLRRQRTEYLEFDLTSFCEVRKLFLGGNNIGQFTCSTVFHSLKYLELAGTQMVDLPVDFAQMVPNLRVLNLSNNEIHDISPLKGLERLERLMLPNNKLTSTTEISEVLTFLPRLKALDMRANTYTARFYAPLNSGYEVDYFANFDGVRNSTESLNHWIEEDEKFLSTLSDSMRKRREAYHNLIWAVCRSLRWHDGRAPDKQQLLQADEYIESFTQESLRFD